jgi:HK97 family phage major capsid protein
MATLANGLVNGTGVAQGTGILAEDQITNTVTYSGSVTYANVVATVAALKRGYANGAVWAMNNATLYNQFYGLVDGNKRPIFIADPKDESIGKVLGFPVVIDDNIADNTVYFGNFARFFGYNIPEGIMIEASRDSGFKKGVIDYRALAVADTKPIVAEAFVKLSKATA